eukprot:m.233334 g.233334  ORF g.233334 m.233334 type:complete len:1046 (-) comp15730_c0_seq3:113-3250(-)
MERPPPDEYVCPLTFDVMVTPVCAPDGRSYERDAIIEALAVNPVSPFTRAPMSPDQLWPNLSLRGAIEGWRSEQPLAIDPDRLVLEAPEVVIGRGSFGKVIAGTLMTHGRTAAVAVKMLPEMSVAEASAQFEKELRAHITAQQGADGVCRLIGTCEKLHRLCLVMRRYECNLATVIANAQPGGIDPDETQRIAHSLLQTLTELHEAGVVVKDIKPENVLFDKHKRPVFSDFGISVVVSRTTKVMPTSVSGTFNFLAPEAFEVVGFGVQVDIWAMGCLVVQMCTGEIPWAGMQMHQIMMAVCVHRKAPNVPDHTPAASLIRQCFTFDPAERPTAAALAEALAPAPPNRPAASAQSMADLVAQRDTLQQDLETARATLRDQQVESRVLVAEERVVWKEQLRRVEDELATTKLALQAAAAERDTSIENLRTATRETAALVDENQRLQDELTTARIRLNDLQLERGSVGGAPARTSPDPNAQEMDPIEDFTTSESEEGDDESESEDASADEQARQARDQLANAIANLDKEIERREAARAKIQVNPRGGEMGRETVQAYTEQILALVENRWDCKAQDAELELTMITRRSVTAMEGATRVQNGLLDLDLAQAVTDRSFDVHEDFEEIMQCPAVNPAITEVPSGKLKAAIASLDASMEKWTLEKESLEREMRLGATPHYLAEPLIRYSDCLTNSESQRGDLEMQMFALGSTATSAKTVAAMERFVSFLEYLVRLIRGIKALDPEQADIRIEDAQARFSNLAPALQDAIDTVVAFVEQHELQKSECIQKAKLSGTRTASAKRETTRQLKHVKMLEKNITNFENQRGNLELLMWMGRWATTLLVLLQNPPSQEAIDVTETAIESWEDDVKTIERLAKASGVKTQAAKRVTLVLMKRRSIILKFIVSLRHVQCQTLEPVLEEEGRIVVAMLEQPRTAESVSKVEDIIERRQQQVHYLDDTTNGRVLSEARKKIARALIQMRVMLAKHINFVNSKVFSAWPSWGERPAMVIIQPWQELILSEMGADFEREVAAASAENCDPDGAAAQESTVRVTDL